MRKFLHLSVKLYVCT